ncbi:MAG: choice-of-anchor J domain-containing protein [Muribaculaceae bacterium]|nr:choice-of-anchor J domain-containing protein [Muribaculaceae bacterium]
MKRFNYYLSLMLLLVFTAACSDEFDQPPMIVPTAEHTANMTIAEFKAKHWQDAVNYIDTVTEDEIIHGWVTSSDESGNIYKSLYITDESGAGLSISINQNSLYNNYRIGQEIVIPLKGYFVGKYNGQQQLGYPQWYAARSVWEATFLPQAMWESMVEINGLPDPSKVQPVDVSISDFQGKTDGETLMKYQGKLVRISGVHFVDANGVLTYANSDATTNRTVADEDGNQLVVRNSNYADFRSEILPDGTVDIVGLLSFYATSQNSSGTWQFYLRDINDVIGGGGKGTRTNPYTIAEAIEAQGAKGWATGYVVGAVAPEVTTVSSNADIEWKAPTTLDNTLVLADDPNCTDINKCVIVPLAQGSLFRTEANLKDHPALYKKVIKVKGEFTTIMGKPGIVEVDNYELPPIPVLLLDEGFSSGIPGNWSNVTVSGDKSWYHTEFDNNGYAAMTGFKGNNPPFDAWLITPCLDIENAASKILTFRTQVAGYGSTTSKFEVYILDSPKPNEATVKVKLNPAIATPTGGSPVYSDWKASGDVDLSNWADGCYYIGFRFQADQDANYATWCVDDVKFGHAPKIATSSDFETMPAHTTTLGTYTSAAGWTAKNCTLLEGGAADGNPVFAFIGYALGSTSDYAKAPTMNGGTATTGSIVSPVLKGGMTKLRFNYGSAYSGKLLSFRVDVKQNGNVVKTWTISNDNVAQKTAYTFEEACSVSGDFTIEFTNLCPSNATGNKDRASIWNVNWDSAQ